MSQVTVEIGELTLEDRPAVRDLHARAFEPELAFEDLVLHRLFTHPHAINLVARSDGAIVGYACGLHGTGPRARLLTIHTDPSMRRLGVASHLLTALIDRVRARRAKRLELDVHQSNEAAIELYRAHGFEIDREDPTAYPSMDPSTGYVMRLAL